MRRTEDHYRTWLARELRLLRMHGISPKVGGQTIGIPLARVFVPPRGMPRFGVTGASWSRWRDVLRTGNDPVRPWTFTWTHGSSFPALLEPMEPANFDELVERYRVSLAARLRPQPAAIPRGWLERARAIDWSSVIALDWSRSFSELLKMHRLVVQGDPGAGKSTLTRYVAWACGARDRTYLGEVVDRVPARIRAVEIAQALEGRVATVHDAILHEAAPFGDVVAQALEQRNGLVMIDGLDEVATPAARTRVSEAVSEFLADPLMDGNAVIITSRIVGYEPYGAIAELPHVRLSALRDEDIEHFLRGWLETVAEGGGIEDAEAEFQEIRAALRKSPGLQRLTRNPLLLTMIALLRERRGSLPEQRVRLYDAATETLIGTWPSTQRDVKIDEPLVRELLAPVAFQIHAQVDRDVLDEHELLTALAAATEDVRGITGAAARSYSDTLLKDITSQSGVILPRGSGDRDVTLYGFLHQTFTEYLAGFHLAKMWPRDPQDVLKYAHLTHWREVILLAAGQLGLQSRDTAGGFVEAIAKLHSTSWEETLHRDLLLACQILADGVPAGPGKVVRGLLRQLLAARRTAVAPTIERDCREVIEQLGATEYRDVLIDITREELPDDQLIGLATTIGAAGLEAPLEELVRGPDEAASLDAAILLAKSGSPDALARLRRALESGPDRVRAAIALMPSSDQQVVGVLDRAVADGYTLLPGALQALFDHDARRALAAVLRRPRVTRHLGALTEMNVSVDLLRDAMKWPEASRVLLLRWITACDRKAGENLAATVVTDPEPSLRLEAGLILQGCEEDAESGRNALRQLLSDHNEDVQLGAATELVKSDDAVAIKWLEANWNLRSKLGRQATSLLVASGHREVRDAILDDDSDPEAGTERWTSSLLAAIDEPAARRRLRALLAASDPKLRAAAAEQLITSSTPGPAFDALVTMLEAGALEPAQFIYVLLPATTRPAVGDRISALAAERRPASRDAARLLDRVPLSSKARAAARQWIDEDEKEIAAAAALTLLGSNAPQDRKLISEQLSAMISGAFDVEPGDSTLRVPGEVAEQAVRHARELVGDTSPSLSTPSIFNLLKR